MGGAWQEAVVRSIGAADERMVRLSGWASLALALGLVCVVVPVVNYMRLNPWVFRVMHHWRHHVMRRHGAMCRKLVQQRTLWLALLWCMLGGACAVVGSADVVVVTKRLGRVAAAFMPALFLLTLRPSPLPYTLYLSLLPMHKWLGRVVVLQATVHSALYTWYFATSGKMAKMKKTANWMGAVALLAFVLIAATSLPAVRRRRFRTFYYVHYVGTWVSVLAVHVHSRPPVTTYTVLNVALLLYQAWYRISRMSTTTVTVVPISTSLALLEFPLADLVEKPQLPSGHVRINLRAPSILGRVFQHIMPMQHPFTVASLPTDTTVRLIVRKSRFPLVNNGKYYVTGAFEPKVDFLSHRKRRMPGSWAPEPASPFQCQSPSLQSSPLHYNIKASRVLMVVGGSAISFGLPFLRILNFNGVNVRLIWVCRDYHDLRILSQFRSNFNGLEIYVTGTNCEEQDLNIDYVDYDERSSEGERDPERCALLSPKASEYNCLTPTTGGSTLSGRDAHNYSTFQNRCHSCKHLDRGCRDLEDHAIADINDEIDFTDFFSTRHSTSKYHPKENSKLPVITKDSVFRKPNYVVPPVFDRYDLKTGFTTYTTREKLSIPTGVKLFFGRPVLSPRDYHWCLQKECIGPSETNECCRADIANSTHVDDLARVWVLAAGPQALVEATRIWASDGGLHFHEESFKV
ncbi:ACL139Wp [Eremothecium gossypii ATCC 10895]|uniref:Probable ferric reductase transmembrane component n=1 Tax=Eremothecium gossypii (strain ATCC 10895 / CBS 109.51 / FGSC 9923 / NRRL Y-1056) TaxID=284811 RepID=FRE8_EREGS|nr:ACL139Wp [Eremothecium gossypii ATCC 10895]Q75CQ8.1 RecName: Full=Probable ferric reductase transmembrane component; AltName: Full=Ferric-chelate reductase 8 [Eremothecium gossypii ATCC 10895]AAS51089.1 ACL139Wp [Eremothecium gossypii ATCC 10895]AEY95379.1 FACL139Wp [Eremothecium gossypii FDAG1]